MHFRSSTTIGEALLGLGGLAGFVYLLSDGTIETWNDMSLYAGMLGIVVGFYAALLLCRAIFSFMVGNDHFWWERYQDPKSSMHPVNKKK